jgi:hypothetical protein
MNCEFCNKSFSTRSNLNAHLKSAKYCLKLRNINIEEKDEYLECKYCENKYYRKDYLKKHLDNCKKKILIENEKLKNEKEKILIENEKLKNEKEKILLFRIDDLKDCNEKISELAKIPKTINNTTTNNTDQSVKKIDNRLLMLMSPSDILNNPDKVKKIFQEKYRTDHLMKGIEGLANFSIQHLLKTEDGKYCYLCTDPSRKTFVYHPFGMQRS